MRAMVARAGDALPCLQVPVIDAGDVTGVKLPIDNGEIVTRVRNPVVEASCNFFEAIF